MADCPAFSPIHFSTRAGRCVVRISIDRKLHAPFAPDSAAIAAARLMLQNIDKHAKQGDSFAFETTLSGRAYLRHIARWQQAGYEVKLIFLRLSSAEEAVARVAQRVRQGGHDIPPEVIRRRFVAGLENFQRYYAPAVDVWALYDNAGEAPVLLDWRER